MSGATRQPLQPRRTALTIRSWGEGNRDHEGLMVGTAAIPRF